MYTALYVLFETSYCQSVGQQFEVDFELKLLYNIPEKMGPV